MTKIHSFIQTNIYWEPDLCWALFWVLGILQWTKQAQNPCPHEAYMLVDVLTVAN